MLFYENIFSLYFLITLNKFMYLLNRYSIWKMIDKLQKLLKVVNEILLILLILHNLIYLIIIDQIFQFEKIHFSFYTIFCHFSNIFISKLNILNRLFRIKAFRFTVVF